jgi:hypothetical protein
MKYIYAYTKPVYLYNSDSFYFNLVKIGETVLDPLDRISQQDDTSDPEPPVPIGIWEVDDSLRDGMVHSFLEERGYKKFRQDTNREWFIIPGSLEEKVLFIESVISEMEETKKCNFVLTKLFEERMNISYYDESNFGKKFPILNKTRKISYGSGSELKRNIIDILSVHAKDYGIRVSVIKELYKELYADNWSDFQDKTNESVLRGTRNKNKTPELNLQSQVSGILGPTQLESSNPRDHVKHGGYVRKEGEKMRYTYQWIPLCNSDLLEM